jgi:restriction system protein
MARARKDNKGPQFVRFFGPVIDALKELGGSGRPSEVEELIFNNLEISEQEQNEQLKSGGFRLRNQINWARFYLAKTSFIDASERGVWSLTEKGLRSTLSDKDALAIFRNVQQQIRQEKDTAKQTGEVSADLDEEPVHEVTFFEKVDHRVALISLLKSLPPTGFERLCQRLLRESGFQQVTVTGRSGDGGLDGHGVLQMNPFVSFQVYFQCKRYSIPVSSPVVRDFRGAMMGRADKGIIITTSTFTSDARKEAIRDGVPPIELVDGEKLIDMFATLQLGLIPKTVYTINNHFFSDFQ